MKLLRVLPFARELLQKAIGEGDVAIDGTAGNGHDTLYLATLVGEKGFVYSFDVQKEAIEATKNRLLENDAPQSVTLIHDGHENVKKYLKMEHEGNIAGAIFNLGFLPGSDKTVITKPETTIKAVEEILQQLKKEGIIVLVIYHGHEGGKKEKDAILHFAKNLPQEKYHVLKYEFMNQKNDPPFIIAIEKR